jgi:hypothetical protein
MNGGPQDMYRRLTCGQEDHVDKRTDYVNAVRRLFLE